MRRAVPVEERFWRFVSKGDNCWEWFGAHDKYGYARISRGRRGAGVERAHRVSWRIHRGRIPNGKYVAHDCGNPGCVNPDHLYLTKNPVKDALKRRGKWQVRGERNGKTRLTSQELALLRRLGERGVPRSELARVFKVGESTVQHWMTGTRREYG